MKNERGFKGIWIPAEIWLNEELKIMEKLFLVEIDSLDNEKGCFASNDHFSKFFNLSKNRCSEIIKDLEKKGYLQITYIREQGKKNIKERVIKVLFKYQISTREIDNGIRESDRPIREIEEGYSEKCEDNNTIINNTFNNTLDIKNNSQKSKNDFDESTTEYQLSKLLFESIKQNDSNFKEPNLRKWACHIDKLIRLDNRTIDEIKRVISFATNDKFWKSNILSTSKLRQKFSTLLIQLQERGKGFGTDRKQDKRATSRDTKELEEWQKRQLETAKQFANREVEEVDF